MVQSQNHTKQKLIETQDVGGKTKVYLLKNKILVRIGNYERKVPVGFAQSNYLPPLLGRHEFLETFRVVFDKFQVQFE